MLSSLALILAATMAKNLFIGAPYSYDLNGGAYRGRDDMQARLTDEWISPSYNRWDYISLSGASHYEVTFDLGETPHELSVVEIDAVQTPKWGIRFPSSVAVETSQDGKSFTGRTVQSTPDFGDRDTKYLYSLKFDKALTDRYVRIVLNRGEKGFICIDEVRGFEFCSDGTIDYFAGRKTDESFDCYHTDAVVHFLPMKAKYVSRNTPADEIFKKLSDGVLAANADVSDPSWVKFVRGGGRHLVFDLETCKTVKAVKGQFLSDTASAVGVPPVLVVSISNDRKEWTTVYGATTGMYPGGERTLWTWNAEMEKEYAARYVRVSFETEMVYSTSTSVYVSEISVVTGDKTVEPSVLTTDLSIPYGRRPSLGQCPRNAVFYASINCRNRKKWLTQDLVDELLNYRPAGSSAPKEFFDGIVMTQLSVNVDWKLLHNAAFADGYNLDACEKAIGEYNKAIGSHRDLGVWFTVVSPDKSSDPKTHFDFFREQVDKILGSWKAAGFKNLKLEGFYYLDEGEGVMTAPAIKALSEYLATKNSQIFWCPYYGQRMTWAWHERGYAWACYQPNTMFHGHAHDGLCMAAEKSWIQGMAMEIEIDHPESDVVRKMYSDYLKTAREHGVDKCVKLFYIGGTPSALNMAARSDDPDFRGIYDETYNFISK